MFLVLSSGILQIEQILSIGVRVVMALHTLRSEYLKGSLWEEECPESPFDIFKNWISYAVKSSVIEPLAMVLSTVSGDKIPSSRVVLLRDFDGEALKFFSNYNSRKGVELNDNPNASLLFFWPLLERQIIIEGLIAKTSAQVSDNYFNSRPLESKVNSILSPQSEVIPDRNFLIDKRRDLLNQLESIKRPEHWGGYVMTPSRFEFWQGGPGRLNDRIQYDIEDLVWKKSRLAP